MTLSTVIVGRIAKPVLQLLQLGASALCLVFAGIAVSVQLSRASRGTRYACCAGLSGREGEAFEQSRLSYVACERLQGGGACADDLNGIGKTGALADGTLRGGRTMKKISMMATIQSVKECQVIS